MIKKSIRYKQLLDPVFVTKLNSLELISKKVVEGFMVGLHKSPYHGFSVEYSEHRPYQKGDAIKDIDWKVYARSDKYFIKQYEEETNLICHIVLDISKSMDYKNDSDITKLEYGKILAASLTHLMLNQQDATGLVLFSDKIKNYLTPKSTRTYRNVILKTLSEIVPEGETNTAASLNMVAEKIKKRGLVIVISDLLDSVESVISAIKHLHFKNNEVLVFQILDPSEVNLSFDSDSVFIDKESGEELRTQPLQIRKAYQTALKEFLTKIRKDSRNAGVEYNMIETTTSLDKALIEYFKKRAKMN